jgi:DNA polymerase III alpha subunit
MYAALWCKSNYSFLEGASHPEELVEQAHLLGLQALAITDRDGLYGAARAHIKARELGLPLILGAQVTVEGSERVVLLARSRQGYAQLCRLISAGRLRSPKGQFSMGRDELCEHAHDLIALWAPEPLALRSGLEERSAEESFDLDSLRTGVRWMAGWSSCAGPLASTSTCGWRATGSRASRRTRCGCGRCRRGMGCGLWRRRSCSTTRRSGACCRMC